jgi:cytoskeletal protein CcmA (bactofilin family)
MTHVARCITTDRTRAQAKSTSRSSLGHQTPGAAGREARIGSGARVRGRIHGDGDLTVDGYVAGDIVIQGQLTISEGGSVEAESVEAESLTIGGSLEGDVRVSGQVRALAGSKVTGNVRGGGIAIDDGAEFAGRIDCEFSLPAELEGGGSTSTSSSGSTAASRRR